MRLQMLSKRSLGGKRHAAHMALIRVVTCVAAQVLIECGMLLEGHRAELALVGSVIRVDPHVLRQVTLLPEVHLADVALEGPVPRVGARMTYHTIPIRKLLSTQCALVAAIA